MGKGDKKTRKGKITIGTFGVRRPKKVKKAIVAPKAKKPSPKKAKSTPKPAAEAPKAKKAASAAKETKTPAKATKKD
jgi:30S ribosomal protein S31